MRCFTGYIVQGIDDSWNLVRYTLAFRLTKGKIKKYVNFFYFEYKFGLILQGSNTGTSIKRQYYQILDDYKIETVYKNVADQAANMKKAFVDEQEGVDKNSKPEDFYLITAQNLLIEQRRADLDELKKKQEEKARQELEIEIEEMNAASSTKTKDFINYNREQVKFFDENR